MSMRSFCVFAALLYACGCMSIDNSGRDISIDILVHTRNPWSITVLPYPYQDSLLPSDREDRLLNVDFFVRIKNDTNYSFLFPSEEFSFGFDALELEIVTRDGVVHHARKRAGQWTRNLPMVVTVPPHDEILYPVSLDPRIWDGIPMLSPGDKVSVCAHLAKGYLLDSNDADLNATTKTRDEMTCPKILSTAKAIIFRSSPASVDPTYRRSNAK